LCHGDYIEAYINNIDAKVKIYCSL